MRFFKISWSSRKQCVTHSRREKIVCLFWSTNLNRSFGFPFCDVSNHLVRYICCSLCGERSQFARGSGWKCSHFGCNLQESFPPPSYIFLAGLAITDFFTGLLLLPVSVVFTILVEFMKKGSPKLCLIMGIFSKIGLVAI